MNLFADCMCAKIVLLFSHFFWERKTFAFPPIVLMSIFSRDKTWNIFCQHYITHCCTSSSKLWRFFSSFCSTAFQYQSFEKNTKGLDMELIRLLGNYELEEKNVLLAFCYCFLLLYSYSFFTLCASWSVELLSKNSQKHEVHLTLIKTFFPFIRFKFF